MLIHAKTALLPMGWAQDVTVELDAGRILRVSLGAAPEGTPVDCLLPAPANLHSHTFQRAMAGLTEHRGPRGQDSFWTWRDLMYRFLAQLTPEDVQAIAAQVMVETAEAGFASVAEFHYLHHASDGPYDDLAEMSGRIAAAASETGLGLTLLPVLYEQGGCDGRALNAGQRRFGNDPNRYARLWDGAARHLKNLPGDSVLGTAPHSLRAVTPAGLAVAARLCPKAPIHIHAAEQQAEVDEVMAAYGARPVEWLLRHHMISPRWCLIHATQMLPSETEALAATGAVAGLCPITEANLGDGIFDGARYLAAGGRFGVGSDSNIRISLAEELRLLEYSQRLGLRSRAVLASAGASTGRTLFQGAAEGGALAAGRATGAIAPGQWGDLLALDLSNHPGLTGDRILDAFIFAAGDGMVDRVWSAGRALVERGRHPARDAIRARFHATLTRLGAAL